MDLFKTNGSSPPSRFANGFYPGEVAPAVPAVDFLVANHGSIFLLEPLTAAARAWADEHLPPDYMLFGASIVVEHRFIRDIVEGAVADGLRVR